MSNKPAIGHKNKWAAGGTFDAMDVLSPKVIIHPGSLHGTVRAPPSKSVMQRVLAILLLRNASTIIHNPGDSADDRVLKNVLLRAGFRIADDEAGSLHLTAPGGAQQQIKHVYFGESGLAARMLTPILALHNTEMMLDAAPALCLRPMHFVLDTLQQLGVRVSSGNGFLPAMIHGSLHPRNITIDASLSSQFLSGLLMAYAAAGAGDVCIRATGLVSKPYIDLTLQIMESIGLPVPYHDGYEAFYFSGNAAGRQVPPQCTIEGDWSAAAFWLVAGAISGTVAVTGLDAFSAQGDKHILQALMDSGPALSIETERITVRQASLKAFQFDATDCPDLFPPLAVLACYAAGTSAIAGVGRLAGKESNRALTIQSELGKMGARISLQDDLMMIRGGGALQGAEVSSHNDHRIAMMCAIAASGATGDTAIDGADAVRKSYPHFFKDLQKLGGRMSIAE